MANNNKFNLTLDTIGPVGTITRPKEHIKASTGASDATHLLALTHSNGDTKISADDTVQMCLWFDGKATSSSLPENPVWKAAATTYKMNFTADGKYYYHAAFRDALGNISAIVNTDQINYDTTKPIVFANTDAVTDAVCLYNATTGSTSLTNTTSVAISFYAKDNGATSSGLSLVHISGDCTAQNVAVPTGVAGTGSYEGYTKYTMSVTLTSGDGQKTVTVAVEDAAGNISDTTKTFDTITLDTALAPATLILLNTSNSNLPAKVNNVNFKIKVTTTANDIAAYTFYGDIAGTTHDTEAHAKANWITWNSATKPEIIYPDTLSFTTGDGDKKVYLLVKDTSGNITTSTTTVKTNVVTTLLDTTNPTVSLSVKAAPCSVAGLYYVSAVDGYNKVTFTATATDAGAGIASTSIYNTTKDVELGSIISEEEDKEFTVSTTHWTSDSSNEIELRASDNAGNTATSDAVTIIFDNTSPVISINALAAWYNAVFNPIINISDASSGIGRYWLWVNNTINDTQVPYSGIEVSASNSNIGQNLTVDSGNVYGWDNLTESATCYLHFKAVDKVGNVSYAHATFGYDSSKPTVDTLSSEKAVVKKSSVEGANYSEPVVLNITYSGTPADVVGIRVYGDIKDAAATNSFEAPTEQKTVFLTGADGKKTIYVTVQDIAGNVSEPKSVIVEYDTTTPAGTITFCDAGTTNDCPDYISYKAVSLNISYTDDALGGLSYQVYGDISKEDGGSAITYDKVDGWTSWTKEGGAATQRLDGYYLTDNTGNAGEPVKKEVYLALMDNAGNITTGTIKDIVYFDDADPTVQSLTVVAGVQTVSCVENTERPGHSLTEDNKYCDTILFNFTPSETIQEYKVVAYLNQAAAESIIPNTTSGYASMNAQQKVAKAAAIGIANGSNYMSASGLKSNATVNCKIKGKDLRTALGGSETVNVDGAHIIVVYVKSMGGRWSAAATFTA